MSRVRSKDTTPELQIRRLLYRLGYRYRLHRRDLPGVPDVVFPGRKKVIFIHGCFWHQHRCKRGRRIPATRQDYWIPKLSRNVGRDRANRHKLRKMGWQVLIVWECQIRRWQEDRLVQRLVDFLGDR